MSVKFFDLRLHDMHPPLNTEDAFRAFAGAADIQDFVFDNIYQPTLEGWTLDEGISIKVTVRAPRFDDGFTAWDDSVSEWLGGTPSTPAASEAYWDAQVSAWGDGESRWS